MIEKLIVYLRDLLNNNFTDIYFTAKEEEQNNAYNNYAVVEPESFREWFFSDTEKFYSIYIVIRVYLKNLKNSANLTNYYINQIQELLLDRVIDIDGKKFRVVASESITTTYGGSKENFTYNIGLRIKGGL